jgi:integrase/recombinase XerD
MKLVEAIKNFVKNLSDLSRSPATITAYQKDLEQLDAWLKSPDINQVTSSKIQEFLTEMAGQGYSTKSLSRKLNSIKSLFKFLHKSELILVDPSVPVPHPEFTAKLARVLSDMEYRSLRDLAKENADWFKNW